MRRARLALLALAAVLLIAHALGPVAAMDQPKPPSPEIETAIQAPILGQMEAFQLDDGVLALSFAVPEAVEVYGTPKDFMTMIRDGYHPIYRPESFSFEGAVADDDIARQLVRVKGENGESVLALYALIRQEDGRWLIAGVQTVPVKEEDEGQEL